jgi:hypothetical protein
MPFQVCYSFSCFNVACKKKKLTKFVKKLRIDKIMKGVAGYLQMPIQWFDNEELTNEVRTFTVYHNDGKVAPHPDLRDFWLSRIVPVYATNRDHLVHYHDTKSNPRRVHPFAVVYHEWCELVYEHALNPLTTSVPVCVMKRCVLPASLSLNFRKGLPVDMEPFLDYSRHDGLPALVSIQCWWRGRKAVRITTQRRMDPDVLFALPKKSQEFYIRLAKAGVDRSTYDTMS